MPRTVNENAPHIVQVRSAMPANWVGWRFTPEGRYLVSPDGDKISAHRLAGLLWRDHMELLRAGYASRRKAELNTRKRSAAQKVKVVIVNLDDWHARNVGSRAG